MPSARLLLTLGTESVVTTRRMRLVRMGKALGNSGGVEHFFVVVASKANDLVAFFNLIGINGVNRLIGMILTGELAGSVVHHLSLDVIAATAYRDRHLIFVHPHNPAFDARIFR